VFENWTETITDFQTEKKKLFNAVLRDDARTVEELLKQHPETVRLRYGFKKTILHCAVELGRKETVKMLLTSSPHLVDLKDYFGRTAIHYADRETKALFEELHNSAVHLKKKSWSDETKQHPPKNLPPRR
jgi:ankyrin repeat protein